MMVTKSEARARDEARAKSKRGDHQWVHVVALDRLMPLEFWVCSEDEWAEEDRIGQLRTSFFGGFEVEQEDAR